MLLYAMAYGSGDEMRLKCCGIGDYRQHNPIAKITRCKKAESVILGIIEIV
jgi:hypothetical protein